MPIPSPLRSVVGDKRFWTAYLRNERYGVAASELEGLKVELAPAADYQLELTLSQPVAELTLSFAYPGGGSVEIGTKMAGRSCGNILRWDDLDLIARAIALINPDISHPGLGTLLLTPFAPIRPGDDADRIVPLLEAAFRSLGLFSEREVDDQIERLDRRREAIDWQARDPRGWVLDLTEKVLDGIDHEGYSTKVEDCGNQPDPGDFPHEAWARMLEAARRTCRDAVRPEWLLGHGGRITRLAAETGNLHDLPVLADALAAAGCDQSQIVTACRNPAQAARACVTLELLAGVEPGEVIRRHFGPTVREPRPFHSIVIYVPILRTVQVTDHKFGIRLRDALKQALMIHDDVEIRHNIFYPAVGVRRDIEGIDHYILIYATTWAEPTGKLAAIRQILIEAGPPPGTILRFGAGLTSDCNPVPIRLESHG